MTNGEWFIGSVTAIYALFSAFTFAAIYWQAKTASRSADAQVAAESAWIMISLEKVPGHAHRFHGGRSIPGSEPIENTSLNVRIKCTNTGKTPAWITEKRAAFIIRKYTESAFPTTPDLDACEWVQPEPEPLAAQGFSEKDAYLEAKGRQGFEDVALIYGMVKYRDIFGREDRFTTFGFRVTLSDTFERLPGYPEYNMSK
jgi:hypothetical protein